MPLYTYRCPKGHTTEDLRREAQRNEPMVCECGEDAFPAISLPGSIKFGVPGVKGHFTKNADGSGTRC
jgi:hypothetical protein